MRRRRGRLLAAAAGIAADMLLGEPPLRPHPVSAFGLLMRRVETALYGDGRGRGVAHALAGVAVGAAAGTVLRSTAAATYLAVAERALTAAAADVDLALRRGDLGGARRLLPALVGRDTDELGDKDVARATIESLAENSVDAIVAPACFGALGGPALALAYRAVNTMDASIGHRNDRYGNYGWAAARLDDAANYVPARFTALLVALVRPRRAHDIWVAVRRDAPAHPSPNAGVAEAAFAAALGVELGGTSTYGGRVEHRPPLGRGRPAEPADISAAIALCRHVTVALAAGLTGAGLVAVRAGGTRR